MTTPRSIALSCSLLSALLILAGAGPGAAQSTARSELKQRFEQRAGALGELKQAGHAGETWAGYVAMVGAAARGDEGARRLVEGENADRKRLYAMLAEELKADLKEPERSMMTPQVVAERNAARNFEKAADTTPLSVAEGTWTTKKDRPWLLELLRLQNKGRVGEAPSGYVEAVRPEDAREERVKSVIERENKARREQYEKTAMERGVPLETVAAEQARRLARSVHSIAYVKGADGKWGPRGLSSSSG